MSGPITPPLTVTTASGTPSGRPITTIKVSDGDLTISGNVATIDTSGSGGVPGGSTTEIQYNNAGAFAGDAGFVMQTVAGGSGTVVDIGGIRVGGSSYGAVATGLNQSILIMPDGTGQLTITPGAEGGGTQTDIQVNVQKRTTTDDAIIELKASTGTIDIARIKLDGSSDLILDNSYNTDKDLDLKIGGTGQVEIENQTTDNDTTLSVKGNGTGNATINLNNPTKSVQLMCDTNQKLKVQGGVNTFVFDASSATGGITWPDGTTQITAASGVSFPLEAPGGSAAAPSYSFTGDTNTGMFSEGADEINFTLGGTRKISFEAAGLTMNSGQIIADNAGTPSAPSISFSADLNTGIYRYYADTLSFSTGGNARLTVGSGGDLLIGGTWGYDGAAGTSGQVLSSGGAGSPPTWEDAGGGGNVFNAELPGDTASGARYIISQSPPFGSADKTETLNASIASKPMCFPFISPASGDVTEIGVNFTTSSASGNLYVAIYDSDSNGMADSRLCYATIASTGTGNVYQTSITGTGTLVRGTQYWYSINMDAGSIAPYLMGATTENTPGMGMGANVNQDGVTFFDNSATAYAVPPASFTSSYTYGGFGRPICSLKIA